MTAPIALDGAMRLVDPSTDRSWASLMEGERGSLFGAPPWIDAIAQTYGISLRANVLEDEHGRPYAGVAFAEIRDGRGERVLSLPFCERLDPVLDSEAQWHQLVAPILEIGVPVELRVFDGSVPGHDARFRGRHELGWHGTALEGSSEQILQRLRPAARRNARNAVKSGVTVHLGADLEDVEAFYRLHLSTRKYKYRLLAQPFDFFRRIWSNFAAAGDLVVALARHEGDVIAGMMCLRWNDIMYYKFGASLADRLSVRPNELLASECLVLARERGCHFFDWGVSDLDQPGLLAYKRKFATEERVVRVLRYEPPAYDASTGSELGALLGDLTELLTRDDVPDGVTQRAGEMLYRYFC